MFFFVGGFHYISLSTQRFVLMALSCPLSWHFMASSHHQLSACWLCCSYSESYCCETQKSQIVGFAAGSLVRKELLTELPSAVFCLYCELQQGLFRTSVCVYFVCVFWVQYFVCTATEPLNYLGPAVCFGKNLVSSSSNFCTCHQHSWIMSWSNQENVGISGQTPSRWKGNLLICFYINVPW